MHVEVQVTVAAVGSPTCLGGALGGALSGAWLLLPPLLASDVALSLLLLPLLSPEMLLAGAWAPPCSDNHGHSSTCLQRCTLTARSGHVRYAWPLSLDMSPGTVAAPSGSGGRWQTGRRPATLVWMRFERRRVTLKGFLSCAPAG